MLSTTPTTKSELIRSLNSLQIDQVIVREPTDKADLTEVTKELRAIFRSPNSKVAIIAIRGR